MSDHDAFLHTIRDHPADDTARLVFADWLTENGDPDRGEFIRVQCELARTSPHEEADERRRRVLFSQQDELLKRHRQTWLAPFLPYAREASFDRGFITALHVPIDAFLAHGERWLGIAPITRVRFQIYELWNGEINDYISRTPDLFASPLLSKLEVIDLADNGLIAADIEVLARHPDLGRLKELDLAANDIRSEGAIALAGMPQLAGLEVLDLMGNNIGDTGGRAIAQSPYLGRLKVLQISKNPIRDRTWKLLQERFGIALLA